MLFGTPTTGVTDSAFRNEAMNMRIPFEIPPEGVKDTDETGSEAFRFIILIKAVKDNTADSRKKTVKEGAVFKEEMSQFFCNGKNTMSVRNIDNLKRHGGGSVNGIFHAAGRTKTAVASKGYKFERTTARASVHGAAIGRIPTVDHFIHVFNNRSTRM
jgi:hypothetical protein